ncbi:MAG: hypothetical protein IH983_00100 [Planctomycetes bacterium]|nr:hypothetical protein [Planctomycetota bacterium]
MHDCTDEHEGDRGGASRRQLQKRRIEQLQHEDRDRETQGKNIDQRPNPTTLQKRPGGS